MNIYKVVSIVTFLFCMLCYLPASAHQDRILEQKGDKIVGLPDQFLPAIFNKEEMVIQIGENRPPSPNALQSISQKTVITLL